MIPEAPLENKSTKIPYELVLGDTRDIGSRASDLLLGGLYEDAEKIAVWNCIPLDLLPKVYAVIAEKELRLNSGMSYGQLAETLTESREEEINRTPLKRLIRAFSQALARLRPEANHEESIRELVYRVETNSVTRKSILRLCLLKEGDSDFHPETDVVFLNPKYKNPSQ